MSFPYRKAMRTVALAFVVILSSSGVPNCVAAASTPVANSGAATTAQGVSVPTTLSATGAPGVYLRYLLVSHPNNGVIIGKEPNITYVPNKNFIGTDSFEFKVNDGKQDSNIATYTITVTAPMQHALASVTSNAVSGTSPFDQGFVSLTFDDGLLNQYQNAMPILDAAGLKGSFYIITHLSGMAIANQNFEVADPVTPSLPQGWSKSGSAVFTYPVAGQSGKAAEVSSAASGSR